MRRRLIVSISCLLFALLLSGCKPQSATTAPSAHSTSALTVTVQPKQMTGVLWMVKGCGRYIATIKSLIHVSQGYEMRLPASMQADYSGISHKWHGFPVSDASELGLVTVQYTPGDKTGCTKFPVINVSSVSS